MYQTDLMPVEIQAPRTSSRIFPTKEQQSREKKTKTDTKTIKNKQKRQKTQV